MRQRPLVDFFTDIVKATECYVAPGQDCTLLKRLQKYDSNIRGIHYLFGTGEELRETLQQKDKSRTERYEKYPLVFIPTPFTERSAPPGGYHSIANPRIGIAYHTTKDLKAKDRQKESFNNVLYPIQEALEECMLESGFFVAYSAEDFKMQWMDRYDIGRKPFMNIEGVTSDYIDAIEITSSELTIDFQQQCKQC